MISFVNSNTEQMASYRYRTLIPAQQLGAKINDPEADTLIFGKPNHVGIVKEAKKRGKRVIVDFCDDHFDHPNLGPIYRQILDLSDLTICPTAVMRDRISEIKKCEIALVPDPYEMPELEPHANGENLIWFGHNTGLNQVLKKLTYLKNLTVVTGPKIGEGMIQWTPENLDREMRKANISVLPTTKDQHYKSPNRLINSIRMGLFPVCDHHPSYKEFSKFIYMGETPTGVKWAREFASELNDMVKVGQEYIRNRYSPEAIGRKWDEALRGL